MMSSIILIIVVLFLIYIACAVDGMVATYLIAIFWLPIWFLIVCATRKKDNVQDDDEPYIEIREEQDDNNWGILK